MKRLLALDGMRGVAAILVMLLHVGPMMDLALMQHGYLMVDLFFLMSGFVLSGAFGERLAQPGQAVGFAGARLLRLWPLGLTGLLLGLASISLAVAVDVQVWAGPPWMLVLAGALFLPWLSGGLVAPLNGPLWSLQAEVWSNIVWGFLGRWVTDRRLAIVSGLAFAVLAVVSLTTGDFDGGYANNDQTRHAGPFTFLMGWARVAFAFPLGILLHRLWARGRLKLSISSKGPLLPGLALMLIAAVPLGVPPIFDLLVVGLLFPVLLIVLADLEVGERFEAPAAVLGRLSYGVYALHGPVLVLFHVLEPKGMPKALEFGYYAIAVAAALATAWAAERWIDRPVRAFVSRRTAPFHRPTVATASVQLGPVKQA